MQSDLSGLWEFFVSLGGDPGYTKQATHTSFLLLMKRMKFILASGFEAKKRDDRFMEYIWQRENWPFFKWGIAQLFPLLSRCRLEQGKLRAWAEAGHGGERVGGEFPRRRNSWVGGH